MSPKKNTKKSSGSKKKSKSKTKHMENFKTKLKKKVSESRIKKTKGSEKKYTIDSLQKAINAMEDEGQTSRQAANNFGILKSTLYAKLKNLPPLDSRKGPGTVLTKDEEDDIVKWILFCAESGCPVTKTLLFDCLKKYIIEVNKESIRPNLFKNNRPGKHWYKAFMRRHPNLTKRLLKT